MKELSLRLKNF